MARTSFAPAPTNAALLLHREISQAGQLPEALWLSAYTGDNPFLLSVREGMRKFGRLTPKQLEAVRSNMERARAPRPTGSGGFAPVTPAIPDGTYTIVSERTGSYRTIELSTPKPGSVRKKIRPGTQIAAYHSGPDNELDFTGFAWVEGATFQPFSQHAADTSLPDWKAALRFLLTGKVNAADAAHTYALKSSRCARCQHKLTVPASLHKGYGPDCAEKMIGAFGDAAEVVRGSAAEANPGSVADAPPTARPGKRTYEDLFPDDD